MVGCFSLHRVGLVLAQPPGLLGDALPAEGQAPVEVAAVGGVAGGRRLVELEVVQVNGGDIWADHGGRLLHDARQQGLQPPVEALACPESEWQADIYLFMHLFFSLWHCKQHLVRSSQGSGVLYVHTDVRRTERGILYDCLSPQIELLLCVTHAHTHKVLMGQLCLGLTHRCSGQPKYPKHYDWHFCSNLLLLLLE